ncbi:MAG: ADP-glyceromanno-heptose 6-epimerase [Planctomycetota bacterium]
MIVVTGGAGFIGSNLLAGLEARGKGDLVVCDSFGTDEKWRNVAKRELADVVRPDELFDLLAHNSDAVEAVVHMGAISATTERDVDRIVENNVRLSLDLWNWCAAFDVRLVYASSAATYGDGSQGFDDDGSVEALARLRPLNAYGWSKHLVDRRVARIVADGGPTPPQWAGLKFFNVYGPNEGHKGDMTSVVAKTYARVAAGEPAVLFRSHHPEYRDGGQLRDFVHVDDCVDAVCWLLENEDVSGLFNLGSGTARSFADLATAVFDALGKEPVIDFVDTPESIRAKYQYFTEARMERLRAVGWKAPATSLEDGVRDYVRNYLATDDPYR